jgi:hypothetical protein
MRFISISRFLQIATLVSGIAVPFLPLFEAKTVERFAYDDLPRHDAPLPNPDTPQNQTVHLKARDEYIDEGKLPADDKLWDKCKSKGSMLRQAMAMHGQQEVLQSPWTSYSDFSTWGYIVREITNGPLANFSLSKSDPMPSHPGWGIDIALNGLGLSDKIEKQGGLMKVVEIYHGLKVDKGKSYVVNGKLYRYTHAQFLFAVNPMQGAIIALEHTTPKYKKLVPPSKPSELPDLQTSSDIFWLYWQSAAWQNVGALRFLWSNLIVNMQTRQIITRVLQDAGLKPEEYPGHVFESGTVGFDVLLGSPNGQTFGYMLAQHKDKLGNQRYISRVQVFLAQDSPYHCLVFHVAPPGDGLETDIPPLQQPDVSVPALSLWPIERRPRPSPPPPPPRLPPPRARPPPPPPPRARSTPLPAPTWLPRAVLII